MPASQDLANALPSKPRADARRLQPQQRKDAAVKVLAGTNVSALARQENVSRPFLYRQAEKADAALEQAFDPAPEDDTVLFNFPVSRTMIRIIVLVLLLRCHSSYHGVIGFFADVFGYRKLSLGTIHNIMANAVEKARGINAGEDLSRIRVGAHDEIFQGDPVLVGMDPKSSYCYLLAQEKNRDATTWGVHLLDCSARKLNLEHVVADAGKGLRAGQTEAWPGVPCWGDVFHPLREFGQMTTYLDNRAVGAINKTYQLERKMERAKSKGKGKSFSKKLALARQNEAVAVQLTDDMRVLGAWLKEDVLALSGPELATRRELFDLIVSELKAREHLAPHRIRSVRTSLENQRDDLLAFVAHIDLQLEQIARQHLVHPGDAREVFEMLPLPPTDTDYWKRDAALWKRLGDRYQALKTDVQEMAEQVVRASSMVENLNSRLRSYFFLRRNIGPGYLELLRFFLNHRRFPRSRKGRQGKSPAEILNGRQLPHWLEQLGFKRFQPTG